MSLLPSKSSNRFPLILINIFLNSQENSEEIEKMLLQEAINLSLGESSPQPKPEPPLPHSVLKATEEGFPLDLALKAYNLVGDDLGLIIQYISEVLLS